MTKMVSFQLDFHKFSKTKRIELSPGLHIVYGESGSGKSHLIRSLGKVNHSKKSHFKVIDINIPKSFQIIFQNPENQILSHTLSLELAFGLESNSIDTFFLQENLKKLQSNLPFIKNWDRHPSSLSGGEMEMLNLVSIFSTNPELVMIDDGLSFLNLQAKLKWVEWMRKKISNNKTIIWFTSDPSDMIFGDSKWKLTLSDLKYEKNLPEIINYKYSRSNGDLSIKVENLSFKYNNEDLPIINNWNCSIDHARIIGLTGKNGVGKTTLSHLITGLYKPASGLISLLINGKKPSIAILDQFPEKMLGHNSLSSFFSLLIKNKRLNPSLVNKCINQLKSNQINWEIIKDESSLDIPWSTLRMSFIIILSHCNYDLLILDEPTFGFGQDQKVILSKFFHEILAQKHLILISHDLPFFMAHCDKIYDLDNQSIINNQYVLTNDN